MRIEGLSTPPQVNTSSPHRPSPGLPHGNELPSKEHPINSDDDMLIDDWRFPKGRTNRDYHGLSCGAASCPQ